MQPVRIDEFILKVEPICVITEKRIIISKKKANELYDKGLLETGEFSSLVFIHKYLFDEIYDFAGAVRDVNIAKGDFRFAPVIYLDSALEHVSNMKQSTFEEIIEKYVQMNICYPFRASNGRSTKIWLEFILRKKNVLLNHQSRAVFRPALLV